ncbi:Flavin-dependent tryptophan halogenase RebH [Devosia equisanguinis]|uniref:Flavin-dependent tryptophan halogenase RebH n=1 Tax=Devosia equisanguinis TaxID=2490941 RepID=A0A3S4GL99_9HYPH|nr:tryptophan halogenase family protein [Devosia equisanguinis]VDS05593.1 Flavin-dependent tryptophan halogenase RebH [Devosia equisanguinis]
MDKPAHFVIVGGGTAGWIAAFIIQDEARRRGLNFRISVVESSRIPTVGVGEATTAAFRVLLKHFGIDEFEFFRKTDASFKLGIRHEDWRRKGFTYYGPIDDPHQVVLAPPGAPSDYLNVYAVAAGRAVQDMHLFQPLLEQKKAPYAQKHDGSLIPLGPFHYAFHFDQALVGKFFASKSNGVDKVDAQVAGVERDGETGDITALVLDDNARLEGDFFIDATGFRKQIIVKALEAPWVSYAHELPVNRALPFWVDVKRGEELANYTRAWAQSSGWMWQIPTRTRYGCGYVYSDEFSTPEQAKDEVERVLGHEIEVRGDIRFQIGRLEKAWIGNCVAVGLSSSFLEPLESTSIHGTIVQMMLFAQRYMDHPNRISPAARDDYNARVGRQVDDFRTFVNTHYVTERDDTPFWREVRANRIHPETRERLARWSREMPRNDHFPNYLGGLPHIETQLHYPVLNGLGLLDQNLARREMEADPKLRRFAQQTFDGLVREYRAAANQALGHAEFLRIVQEMG